MTKKKILLLAGEESGMIYARELAARLPECEIRTYQDYGFEIADLAVFGFAAVLRRIFFFLRVKRTMERAIDEWKPDAIVTIDYPGMNLKLAAYAKSRGVKAVHIVCPQVWAWHQGRIPKIEASLDRLCCFFPFEPSLFRPGLAVFTGHPLARQFEGLVRDPQPKRVALLPGSRKGEVMRILPTLLEVAKLHPGIAFAIPAAHDRALGWIRSFELPPNVEVQLGGAREVLLKSECAVVASGTATLEAAFCGCPTILVYRVSALLAAFLRRALTGTKYVGLANIIWDRCGGKGDQPMPELLQENFTVEAVCRQLDRWLDDADARKQQSARLEQTVSLLKSKGDPIENIVEQIA